MCTIFKLLEPSFASIEIILFKMVTKIYSLLTYRFRVQRNSFNMEHVYREGVPQESENQGGVKFVLFKEGASNAT